MTNKMPVVGKRYKHKYCTNFTIIISNSINNEFFSTDYGWKIHISDFWNWFEELLENKVDLEKEEVNKVERALEELKHQINLSVPTDLNYKFQYPKNLGCSHFEYEKKLYRASLSRMVDRAQNLINALEAEKIIMSKESKRTFKS